MNAVRRFERVFADWLGAAEAFAFWKGRVALYAILRGLGVGENDEVILPGYTCVMNVNPIKYLGARPVYADIDPATYNVAPAEILKKITPRTRVIIAQHTYGYPCEMDPIMELGRSRGIPVVEDCCLALGSRYRGKMCGTFGVASYFSFQWNKPFTTGLGGMAVVNDASLAAKIGAVCRDDLRRPSLKASLMLTAQRTVHRLFIYPSTVALATSMFRWLTKKGLVVGSSSPREFSPQMAEDFFTGMSAGQARAGLRHMRKIEKNLAHRRHMKELYEQLLTDAGWNVPGIPDHMDPLLVRYPVRVADKTGAVAEAARHFIELGTWFECPLHPIETPLAAYDYVEGMCPEAEKACREVVNLPTHLRANHKTARRSVEFVGQIGQAAS
jgi:dTDP-4-amino-4,6-dideoxygalactose transaminase